MPDHVGVGKIDADHLVFATPERLLAGFADLPRLHLRLLVELDLIRGDLYHHTMVNNDHVRGDLQGTNTHGDQANCALGVSENGYDVLSIPSHLVDMPVLSR